MHGMEDPLGLGKLGTAEDHSTLVFPSPKLSTHAITSPPTATSSDAELPLPRFLFSFGLSPSGPASAEMLHSLLHHEGMKSVDARLKECGIRSVGQRLKICSRVLKAAESSSAIPPHPRNMARPVAVQVDGVIVVTGDLPTIKPKAARELVQELVADHANVDQLIALAGQGDRSALTAELKRLGFKTGARLRLEQALPSLAAEHAARENLRVVEQAQEAALQQHREEQRAEVTGRLEAQAQAAQAAEAARVASEEAQQAEREELYAQYQREMGDELSEVEKLKQSRREANAAKREAAEREATEALSTVLSGCERQAFIAVTADAPAHVPIRTGTPSPSPPLLPLIVDAGDGDGGVQGLQGCYGALLQDDDGDSAHEFIELG